MAQNITLLGASYQDVPSVSLPKTGGGTASFVDVSDTTAVAADVASGKYFYLASGQKVVGTSSGGVDVPVFTVTYDNNWVNVISVTCNKTYAECIAFLEEGHTAAIFVETTQSGVREFTASGLATSSGSGSITYTTYNVNVPLYDITYSQNGTLTVVEPSSLEDTLNVTTNGTYTPNAKVWTEVNVNVSGGTPAISVVDTTDSHGGTVREITALDISDTTAVASDVAQGKYFYTAAGVKTAGTASGGGSPSATAHTIYFEFTDETNTTITAYYDSSFISDAITETVPTTYGQKTVTLAQLDGVTWYSYDPTERWETIYENDSLQYNPEGEPTIPPYCWITSLSDVYPTVGSVWRITFDSVTYRCTAVADGSTIIIGNPLYGPNYNVDDGSGVPFAFYNSGYGAWSGAADLQPYSVNHNVPVKIERQITS